MSYAHQLLEWKLADAVSLAAATPTQIPLIPGRTPLLIRGAFAIVTTVSAVGICTMTFSNRTVAGTVGILQAVGTLLIPVATAPGKVIWKDFTPVEIAPGGDVNVIITGSATGNAHIGLVYEPSWDTPRNNANSILSL